MPGVTGHILCIIIAVQVGAMLVLDPSLQRRCFGRANWKRVQRTSIDHSYWHNTPFFMLGWQHLYLTVVGCLVALILIYEVRTSHLAQGPTQC